MRRWSTPTDASAVLASPFLDVVLPTFTTRSGWLGATVIGDIRIRVVGHNSYWGHPKDSTVTVRMDTIAVGPGGFSGFGLLLLDHAYRWLWPVGRDSRS